MLGAEILQEALSETWGCPKKKLISGSTALKMAAYRQRVTRVPGDYERAEMLM
jgi:hypothetical protein